MTFGTGAIFHVELAGVTDTAANRDQLGVTNVLDFANGATIFVSKVGNPAFGTTTRTYTIATTGSLVRVNGGGGNPLSGIVIASDFAGPEHFSLSRSGNDLLLAFNPVPEPAFVTAVFAAGLAGIAGWRRRRKARIGVTVTAAGRTPGRAAP